MISSVLLFCVALVVLPSLIVADCNTDFAGLYFEQDNLELNSYHLTTYSPVGYIVQVDNAGKSSAEPGYSDSIGTTTCGRTSGPNTYIDDYHALYLNGETSTGYTGIGLFNVTSVCASGSSSCSGHEINYVAAAVYKPTITLPLRRNDSNADVQRYVTNSYRLFQGPGDPSTLPACYSQLAGVYVEQEDDDFFFLVLLTSAGGFLGLGAEQRNASGIFRYSTIQGQWQCSSAQALTVQDAYFSLKPNRSDDSIGIERRVYNCSSIGACNGTCTFRNYPLIIGSLATIEAQTNRTSFTVGSHLKRAKSLPADTSAPCYNSFNTIVLLQVVGVSHIVPIRLFRTGALYGLSGDELASEGESNLVGVWTCGALTATAVQLNVTLYGFYYPTSNESAALVRDELTMQCNPTTKSCTGTITEFVYALQVPQNDGTFLPANTTAANGTIIATVLEKKDY